MHAAPSATQVPPAQQPPLQVLPGQQGAPGVPHSWQIPVVDVELQTLPDVQRSVPLVPGQHCSPG
jgi:hypothetical protein